MRISSYLDSKEENISNEITGYLYKVDKENNMYKYNLCDSVDMDNAIKVITLILE